MQQHEATPRYTSAQRHRWIGAALHLTGAAILVYAILPEFSPGSAGVSVRQMFAILAGVAVLLTGWTVAGPSGSAVLADWRRMVTPAQLADFAGYLVIGVQVWLLVQIVGRFNLESPAFYEKILPLVFFGFLVNHLLPAQARLPFFVALSVGGVQLVFGTANGGWLVAVGLVLIGICHLPLRFAVRVALLVVAGAVLAVLRAGLGATPWSGAIWPILGSMFMFRLIAYMYDLRHAKQPVRPAQTLAYFFLLPNLAFPLFPVVDHATFRRTYYDQDALRIYQRGVHWMLVGVTHLLLYRIVYHHFTISPVEVVSPASLSRYLLANFMLYLRVSGQFHLIVGMLHLFGFRLPETHRFFYISSSFTDFWRRINIYWKDFMMKVVYYPTYFRVRQLGETSALIISTFTVFFLTWAFHSYQWFWLLGSVLLGWTDVLFWAILAVFLTVNSLRELKRGRQRSLGDDGRTAAQWLRTFVSTTATFTVICILWSLWSSHLLTNWFDLWTAAGLTLSNVLATVGLVALAGAVLFVLLNVGPRLLSFAAAPSTSGGGPPLRPAMAALAWAFALFLLGDQQVSARLLPSGAQPFARDLRVTELNRQDAAQLQRGYYENLTGVNRFNSQLWEVYAQRPERWPTAEEAGVVLVTSDFLARQLRPMITTQFHGATFSTNRWGMRDRDYEQLRPSGIHRVAMLGQSYVMGSGVSDDETFENVLEDRLNSELGGGFEILNFGVGGTTPPQHLYRLEKTIIDFGPDVVFYVAYPEEPRQLLNHVAFCIGNGIALPFDFLDDAVRRAGVEPGMTHDAIVRALVPMEQELLLDVYRGVVDASRRAGAVPVWIVISTPDVEISMDVPMVYAAREAGFIVLDIGDVYDGHDRSMFFVAPWDRHPNRAGHALIAEGLFGAVSAHAEILGRVP